MSGLKVCLSCKYKFFNNHATIKSQGRAGNFILSCAKEVQVCTFMWVRARYSFFHKQQKRNSERKRMGIVARSRYPPLLQSTHVSLNSSLVLASIVVAAWVNRCLAWLRCTWWRTATRLWAATWSWITARVTASIAATSKKHTSNNCSHDGGN